MLNVRNEMETVFVYDDKTKAKVMLIKHPSGLEVKVPVEELVKQKERLVLEKTRIEQMIILADKNVLDVGKVVVAEKVL